MTTISTDKIRDAIQSIMDYRIADVHLGPEMLDVPDNAMERFDAVESVRLASVRYGSTTMYCLVHQFESRYDVEQVVCRATNLRPTKDMAVSERSELDMQTSYGSQWQQS